MIYKLDDIEFNLELIINSRYKNYYIKHKNNTVYICGFKKITFKEIDNILKTNKEFIFKMISKNQEDLNKILYLGNKLDLVVKSDVVNKINITDTEFRVYSKNLNQSYVDKLIKNFLTNKTKEYVSNRLQFITTKFPELNIKDLEVEYKYTKSYYGKCLYLKNKILFSGICFKVPFEFIDYIIYHELAHFMHPDHSKKFYDYLESKLENARKLSKLLRSYNSR
ncbi:MAG: M48 family metallopeptidase [Anaeroplasmataceae bacterium]